MPRRNKNIPHTPYDPRALSHSAPKKAYASKSEAEQAMRDATRYNLDLQLYTYQSPTDGKWYLSSKKHY